MHQLVLTGGSSIGSGSRGSGGNDGDGQQELQPDHQQGREKKRSFAEGERVQAQWKPGNDTWYGAVVMKEQSDGTYYLRYDDGDEWKRVPVSRIVHDNDFDSDDELGRASALGSPTTDWAPIS